MPTILINAAQKEEPRIAIIDENNKIRDLFLHPDKEETVHNIYKGLVKGIETSLNAVFIDYGADRHGFLPVKDIAPASLYQDAVVEAEFSDIKTAEASPSSVSADEAAKSLETNRTETFQPRFQSVRIEDIKLGQEFIVQVDKEERGNKGAALTNQISLAGRYLVLMPNSPQAGGISRRVEGEDRDFLRESLRKLVKPKDMGVIIRTSGVNKTHEELQWDLDMLLEKWNAIKKEANRKKAPFLIFQDSGIVNRLFRDYLSHDIDQIYVDDVALYEELRQHMEFVRPAFAEKLVLYTKKIPLFSAYGLENQIDNVYQSSVRLDSGGGIVINRTEALVSIDVNSARATRGSGIEETALQINLEAADEIARQLRLRDLGGLIVIDFIDMLSSQHQKDVEVRLKNALRADRARVQIGRISRFGLLEMSRQRLKSSLSEETQVVCSHCKGEGYVRSVQSVALSILRVIEEDAVRGQVSKIQLQVPVDMAAFFLNEKRRKLVEIEENYQVKIVVLPNLNLRSPHYHIKREKGEGEVEVGKVLKSHDAIEAYEEVDLSKVSSFKRAARQPVKAAVDFVVSRPAPTPPAEEAPGLLKRLFTSMFGLSESKPKEEKPVSHRSRPHLKERTALPSARRPQEEGAPDQQVRRRRQTYSHGGGSRGQYPRDANNRGRGRRPSSQRTDV